MPAEMSSKWGSFLQQAVASVEARLDNILAEGEPVQSNPRPRSPGVPTKSTTDASQTSPTLDQNRHIDCLEERLAKAVKTSVGSPGSQHSGGAEAVLRSSDIADEGETASPSRPIHLANDRTSVKLNQQASDKEGPVAEVYKHAVTSTLDTARSVSLSQTIRNPPVCRDIDQYEQVGLDLAASTEKRTESLDMKTAIHLSGTPFVRTAFRDPQDRLAALDAEEPSRISSELHSYIERIDALESKLRYLANDAAQSARKAASLAPPASIEKCIAEKNERISLLMLEGQALACTEQKQRSLIKKLRATVAEKEHSVCETKREKDQALLELNDLQMSAARAQGLDARRAELEAMVDNLRNELSTLRLELEDKQGIIIMLRRDLERTQGAKDSREQGSEHHVAGSQLLRLSELEESLVSLEIEKDLVADRARRQAAEMQAKLEQAVERELRMKREVELLESKLESMRVLVENAASSTVSESQAKLLRQMETLQSQYSSARENWQRIESSLTSTNSALENDLQEALRRESEMRKKAKEMSARCKTLEEELQHLRTQLPRLQLELETSLGQTNDLKQRAEAAESALFRASMPDASPEMSRVEHNNGGTAQIQNRPHSNLSPLCVSSSNSDAASHMPSKQRMLSTLDKFSSGRTPSGEMSHRSPAASVASTFPQDLHSLESPLQYPLLPQSVDREKHESMEQADTLSIRQPTAQDVVSASTVAAGPSIQLVERMSAAVRRLEAEKVTTKEELARISRQRDEARSEIVSLLKEIETDRIASKRVEELEHEASELRARYETTLEMLGEKSELVEELRADVADVKAMYRELVERTVR